MKKIKILGTEFPVHELANGETVAITSKHGYTFSDGTSCQEEMNAAARNNSISFDYLDKIVVESRKFTPALALPRKATMSVSSLSRDSLLHLEELSKRVDVVLVSFMAIDALKQMGIRHHYPKVLAFNSTPETARVNSVTEKVVDLNNWGW